MIEFSAGDVIDNRYEVVSEIGRGGMGVVLKVKNLNTATESALKYCPDAEPDARTRFSREVKIMAAIQHPNVMPVESQGDSYDPPYFTMPIAISSIREELKTSLQTEDALNIFKSICGGVQAIHSGGSTHRDLKPDNVMRMADGRIVVSDLGLARLDERDATTLTKTDAFLGTQMYCAPEQHLPGGSKSADTRTDVFQLGKILYEITTGDLPTLIDPTRIPKGLEHIVERATQQQPDRRYQTVGQLIDSVETYLIANNPDTTPQGEFDAARERATELLEQNKYSAENVEKLLAILTQFGGDNDYYIERFESIPNRLFASISNQMPDLLVQPLEAYCEALDAEVSRYAFSHGDVVAKKMDAIFRGSNEPVIKVLALKGVMIAGVSLNRFSAIEVFDNLLQLINTDVLANRVAEMLRENPSYYERLSGRIPAHKLHPAIAKIPSAD